MPGLVMSMAADFADRWTSGIQEVNRRLPLSRRSRRLIRTGTWMLAWTGIVLAWLWLNLNPVDYLQDAKVYWRFDFDNLYSSSTVGGREAYLYSPAFAQLFSPLGVLPWPAFKALFSAANLMLLAWMAGPRLGALLLLIPGSPVPNEIGVGNIHLMIAAVAVVGFRFPQAWAFNLLTKVTPGIGLLWFAGRRAWRSLAWAVATTTLITGVSFVIAPQLWFEWIDTLRTNSSVAIPPYAVALPLPLVLRLVIAAALALVSGLRNWRWLLPVVCFIALPVPWVPALSLLVGSIAIWRGRDRFGVGAPAPPAAQVSQAGSSST